VAAAMPEYFKKVPELHGMAVKMKQVRVRRAAVFLSDLLYQ
jgi:hypothetical protein